MSQEIDKGSAFKRQQDTGKNSSPRIDGFDLKAAYMALIEGYIELRLREHAQRRADNAAEIHEESDDKLKGADE